MSNRVSIQRTTFTDYPSNETSFGFRYFDDFDAGYDNIREKDVFELEPLDFLKQLIKQPSDDILSNLLIFVKENETGINIDGNWFEWSEIKHLFADESAEPENV